MEGLRLRSTFGIDFLSSLQNFYSPSNTYPGRNFGGQGSRGTATTTLWQNENTLNYRREFGEIHDLDLLGGITFQRITSENVSGTAQGFLTDRLRENALNTAQTFVGVWTGAPRSSLLSYFARANWDISDDYSIYAVIDNVLDKSPPIIGNTDGRGFVNTDSQTYDVIGRYMSVGARVRF